jgi:FAD/FMN-containing dehydrogenase
VTVTTATWTTELRDPLGADGVLLDPDVTAAYARDQAMLGVITEATLALRPAPQRPVTLAVSFATTAQTGHVVERVVIGGPVPSLLEVMDRTCIRAVDGPLKADLDRDAQALLLAQARG